MKTCVGGPSSRSDERIISICSGLGNNEKTCSVVSLLHSDIHSTSTSRCCRVETMIAQAGNKRAKNTCRPPFPYRMEPQVLVTIIKCGWVIDS